MLKLLLKHLAELVSREGTDLSTAEGERNSIALMHHPVNILLSPVSSAFNGLATQLSCIGDMTIEVAHSSAMCMV